VDISFRPVLIDDLPTIIDWQSAPEVKQWYGKETTGKEQLEKYRKEIEETPRLTWHYIIQINGTDAGMIQTYLLSSYPDVGDYVQAGEKAAMVDIFVASKFMHKGHGSHVMRAFLREYVFSGKLFTADICTIGPEPENLSAIRMYNKAGFKWTKTVRTLDETLYIMSINKTEAV